MVVCPQCGTGCDGAKFCPECGAALAVSAVERRERRVVSVVFCDLVGFTSRSESLDVEDVAGFLEPYHALLRGEVERTGGVVSDFAGDGMMAVFGAPVAHEDDPERAVRAGLAIRDAFTDPESDASRAGLHVRVGVTTGEVLVTLAEGGVRAVGDVVNTAARLESAAPVGGVLVDSYTYRATERVIRFEQAEAVAAKGKSEPVQAWLALEPRSIVPEQARVGGLVLVGRDRERSLVVEAMERSCAEPSTQLVSIIGEPGIGKTRLVDELFAHVEETSDLITWRRGRSLSYGEGVAFWALGEMVKSQAGILESDSAQVADVKLSEAVAAVVLDERDRGWVARHLQPLVGLEAQVSGSAEGGRVEAFAAWRRFFEALAEADPTVLVFEDIHWADDALLDFIDLLADRAGALALLIVCTARPELLERREHWGGGKTNATTLSLAPLSAGDTARLVAELLGQALLPAEVQHALLERADGNPLYAQEYVRMLQDRGLLVEGGGGWELTGAVEGLPESIQGIIAARLDTLTPSEKTLVQDAAVVGRTAWIGAACALTERSALEAEELLHGLERKHLLQRVRRSSVQGETEFSFTHALTRDVAYAQIRRADRAHKHEAAAHWIEHLAGQRDDKAELLAHHYVAALDLTRATGSDAGVLEERARRALRAAGDQALATSAYRSAVGLYQAALDLWPSNDPQRARLLFSLGTARFESEAGLPHILHEAADALLVQGDAEQAARAHTMIGIRLANALGDHQTAHKHLDKAVALLADRSSSSAKAWALATRASSHNITGDVEAGITLAREALRVSEQLPEPERAESLANSHMWLGIGLIECDDPEGIAHLEQALTAAAGTSSEAGLLCFFNVPEMFSGLGQIRRAREIEIETARRAEQLDARFFIEMFEQMRPGHAFDAGDWDTALRLADTVIEEGQPFFAIASLTVRAKITLARNQLDAAERDSRRALESARALGETRVAQAAISNRALVALARGERDEAAALADELMGLVRQPGFSHPFLIDLAFVLSALDRGEELIKATRSVRIQTPWLAAATAIANGRSDHAADILADLEALPDEALARLHAAHRAIAEGNQQLAKKQLEPALTFWRTAGATAYLRQAQQLLDTAASA